MVVAITGTPGVGKTTVSRLLKDEGYEILDLNEFIQKEDLREKKDLPRDSYNVDVELLRKKYKDAPKHDIVEGHLSHYLETSPIIVLRCDPIQLRNRMQSKDWHKEKKEENIEAEIMDVILAEAVSFSDKVYEIDTTRKDPDEVKDEILKIIKGKTKKYMPGKVDWSHYL